MKGRNRSRKHNYFLNFCGLGITLVLSVIVILPGSVLADKLQDCMSETMRTADPDTTIAQLQLQCEEAIAQGVYGTETEEEQVAVVEDRVRQDRKHVLVFVRIAGLLVVMVFHHQVRLYLVPAHNLL